MYSAGRHLGTYANGTTYFTLNDWMEYRCRETRTDDPYAALRRPGQLDQPFIR